MFTSLHTFHIPVMGIGYTIDTPAKVAHYGISSVISLVDDMLIEKMREFYCNQFNFPFQGISNKIDDYRAKRITAYLNVIQEVVTRNFEKLINSTLEKGSELEKYLSLLPQKSIIKRKIDETLKQGGDIQKTVEWVKTQLKPGEIDVNIMTKLDREHYKGKEVLPVQYNDAHAALRGFAHSKLRSAVVLSAGMNPSLYGYFEKFEDFFPDVDGNIKKRIILKVSDFRSALIQGKYLAKKGLWVSEFRIESGLNCGGHAFATDGYLLGPILEDFKKNKQLLLATLKDLYLTSLKNYGRCLPKGDLSIKLSAQGGVGNAEEHQFLIDYYEIDSVGWGSPFLLVPEAVSIDENTLKLLQNAKEEDLYLSNISPLGVPFNNVRGNTKDQEKIENISGGKPGSSCPKKHAALNKEFTEKVICIASQQYQRLKIEELKSLQLQENDYNREYNKIVEKACICNGLGTSALMAKNLDTQIEGTGVSVCPGPNIAYFTKQMSLTSIVDHIYGRKNVIKREDRPHMFIKELTLYIEYLKNKVQEQTNPMTEKERKYFQNFIKNLFDGIEYYKNLKGKHDPVFLSNLQEAQKELVQINQHELVLS